MKRLILFAAAIISTCAFLTSARAQVIAPLIQPETVSVGKLNLDKLEPSVLTAQVSKLVSNAVDYFIDDVEQAKEMKEVSGLAGLFIAQYYQTFVAPLKESGVNEVYIVFEQSSDLDNPIYPYIAISTKDLTEAQLKDARKALAELNQQLNSAIQYRFVRNGFLIAVIIPETLCVDEDEAKAYVKKRFSKFNTVANSEIVEGFKVIDPSALLSFVGKPSVNTDLISQQLEQFEETLNELGEEDSELLAKFKEFVKSAADIGIQVADLVKYSVVDVNLDNLEVVSRSYMKSADDAEKYGEMMGEFTAKLNELIDTGLTTYNEDEYSEVAPLTKEELQKSLPVVKDLVNALLKLDIENDVLVWKMNGDFWTDNKDSVSQIVEIVKTGIAKAGAENDVDDAEYEDEEIDLDAE